MVLGILSSVLLLAAAEAAPAPQAPAGPQGQLTSSVTAYPPSFFDEFAPTTAMGMIVHIPGFSFDGGEDARGFSANAGNVLIDGRRPPANNDSLSEILNRIPASSVLRIDVVRGGAPGIDMQGKTIVANVIRKPDGGVSGAAEAGINASSRRFSPNFNISAQRQQGGRTLDGSLSGSTQTFHDDGQGENDIEVAPGGVVILDARDRSTSANQNYAATGAYERPAWGGDFRANTKLTSSSNDGATQTTLRVPGGARTSSYTNQDQAGELGMRYARTLTGGTKLEGVFLQQYNSGSSQSLFDTVGTSSVFADDNTSGQSVLTGTFALPKKGHWTFNGGAEAAYNWFASASRYGLNGSHVFIPGDTTDGNEVRGEVFGSAAWTPDPDIDGEASLRYERSTIATNSSAGDAQKTLGYLKPRLNLNWRPVDGHEFSLTLERSVGQLSFENFAVSASPITGIIGVSNPDLEPEKTWSFEARYEYTFGKRGSFSASYSHRIVTDLIGSKVLRIPANGTTPAQVYDITANVGPATRNNFEVGTNLPLEKVGLKGGYFNVSASLNLSQIDDPVTGVSRRMSNDTPWSWNAGLSQELNQGKLSWSIGASGQASNTSFNPQTINRFTGGVFVNTNLSYRPKPNLVLSASAYGSMGQSESVFILYDAPRDVGAIEYTETRHTHGVPNFALSARRLF